MGTSDCHLEQKTVSLAGGLIIMPSYFIKNSLGRALDQNVLPRYRYKALWPPSAKPYAK